METARKGDHVTSPILAGVASRLRAWLVSEAYPLWWEAGADRAGGGFHDALDLAGAPTGDRKRARVQARQAYCFAAGPSFGWDGPSLEAMRHGLDFLERRHRRPDGLYRATADTERADLYDQAFVIFAFCAAGRVGEQTAWARAEALLDNLPRHPFGGYRSLAREGLEANPNMHLFEAALDWMEAGRAAPWRTVAQGQARLALERLIDPSNGALGENFGPQWRAPPRRDRRIEPGHQFEWAWLLMRWSVLSGDAAALTTALRLIEGAERTGVDPALGVAINLLDGDLAPLDRGARLWPQTERLKAALLAAELTGDTRYRAMAEAASAGLERFLATPLPGLWRDRMAPDGSFIEEPAPASSFYHIVGAISELNRAAL